MWAVGPLRVREKTFCNQPFNSHRTHLRRPSSPLHALPLRYPDVASEPCVETVCAMDRFDFVKAQPWFEEETSTVTSPTAAPAALSLLRTTEHTFASFEIFEGIASFALTDSSSPAHHDDVDEDATFGAISSDSRRITFRASILASSWETRVRLALRPLPQGTTHGLSSKTAESGQPAQPLPAGTKRRRDESVAPTDAACELLVRFESSGRVLQGRLLHGHVMRMREDVTLDAAAGREATTASTDAPGVASQRSVAPYVRLQLTPHLELTLSALPEHSNATATEQLQRLVTRLLDSLRPPPASSCADAGDANRQRRTTGAATAPTFAASAVNDASATDRILHRRPLASTLADTSVSGGQASVAERTAHWQAFVRCARELADELIAPQASEHRCASRTGRTGSADGGAGCGATVTTGSGGGLFRNASGAHPAKATSNSSLLTARTVELLAKLPTHLQRALPTNAAAGVETLAAASSCEVQAEERYMEQGVQSLQGMPVATAALSASKLSAPPRVDDGIRQAELARQTMRRAYAVRLGAMLLPGRSVVSSQHEKDEPTEAQEGSKGAHYLHVPTPSDPGAG